MDLLDTIAAGSSCGWFLTCQPCPCVCAPSRRSTLTSIYRLASVVRTEDIYNGKMEI
jgi:hypothetical protein